MQERPLKCLWIARDIPFPLDAGDRIYSANLARALADTGVFVRFLGFPAPAGALPEDWPVDWIAVPGDKKPQRAVLSSTLPIAAAIHATPAYRRLLDRELTEAWDLIVFDSYGSGWALKHYLSRRSEAKEDEPVLVHVSHNHEEALWRNMAREAAGSPIRKFALWQNYRKVRALERFTVLRTDLTTTITAEDARALRAVEPGMKSITLTPGYSGWVAPVRTIMPDTPRRVVIVGSFRWVVKQENLRRFLELADARFHQHGIAFDVIGDVPADFLAEWKPKLKATHFHGFVGDIAPHFADARIAVVPELIGGGFKLKFLDYIFGRVPVATITEAAAGLPGELREQMICCDSMEALVDALIARINDLPALNAMQAAAYEEAGALYHWRDRGRALLNTVAPLLDQRRSIAWGTVAGTIA